MIAVVIPCYKTRDQILDVIKGIDETVQKIIVVDDKCPQNTGAYVEEKCQDERVEVIYHEKNLGVGGAVKSGYIKALDCGAEIIVKVDGDGQMDTRFISQLVKPILENKADYVKGNRFYELSNLKEMPLVRILGNSFLSLINKFVNGYWNIMDPTNGFTGIHKTVLKMLPLEKISNRYFFESDMLFRMGTIKAVVSEIPMQAKYGAEKSSLNIWRVLFGFPPKYFVRYLKRIFYNYFLRDFNAGTLELIFGTLLVLVGLVFGIYSWYIGELNNQPATSGTVMLAALPVILGFQLLIAGLQYDMNNIPKEPIQTKMPDE